MRTYFSRPRPAERGSIFLLALWSVLLLCFLAAGLGTFVRQKIHFFQKLEARAWMRDLGDSAIRRAMFAIGREPLRNPDSWSLSSRDEWCAYSNALGEVLISVTDEERKLNLNKAGVLPLKILLRTAAGLSEEDADRLAWSIVDYRDADDQISVFYDGGSEKGAYRAAGLRSEPKNAPFETVSEVLLVKGMTKKIYYSIETYITIYGDGRVNINTAPREVLLALDLAPEVVDKILGFRRQATMGSGPESNAFADPMKVEEELDRVYPLSDKEKSSLSHAMTQDQVGVRSKSFRIEAEIRLAAGRGKTRAVCFFGLDRGIINWAEF